MNAAARLAAAVAVLSVAAPSCAGSAAPNEAPAAAPSSVRGVAIAGIQTRDGKVTVLGGGGDLRVVVERADGTLAMDGVSLDELRARDPVLYELVTSSYASNASNASNGTYLDATLDLPAR
jgi:hypothetical protein